MSFLQALPVRLAKREKTCFEVRESLGQTTIEDGGTDCMVKSIPQRGAYGCKGSQLSPRGHDTGNKEIQPIRGSKRTD